MIIRDKNQETQKVFVQLFLNNKWVPNTDYYDRFDVYKVRKKHDPEREKFLQDGLSDRNNYLISPDKRYAVTIKRKVLTIHDVQRQFCKVVSLKLDETTVDEREIQQGNIIFKLV